MKPVLTRHAVTAYLNLEPVHGVSAGESASVSALCASGVKRVVVGLLHPLPRLRGQAVAALQSAGMQVDVPDEADASSASTGDALLAARRVNEALLHRAATGEPFSVWKYAMTLDGKIATRTGHSAWVSGACKLAFATWSRV
jgi:diaminohydroxyphosphoribosylaminopyrimidine deaminase/5-amino-6-(5-phosphoribosylamino)uracil reductase